MKQLLGYVLGFAIFIMGIGQLLIDHPDEIAGRIIETQS